MSRKKEAFPDKNPLRRVRDKLSDVNYQGGNRALPANATEVERAKYQLCQLIGRKSGLNSHAPDYGGDLPKLYKRVQKHRNLSPENPKISNSLKQTLTVFISIIGGLSGLSNKRRCAASNRVAAWRRKITSSRGMK